MQKVVQVNIRLSEGGAAGVARTLADQLRRLGIASPFAYGYGKAGLPSPLEAEYDGVRITPKVIAGVNRISYSFLGQDTRLVSKDLWSKFEDEVTSSDIVHLHAIHSYFTSTNRLFDTLIEAGKPVVWTLHDQWSMTGRCAQPGTCRKWETGCQGCPNLQAYPPARIDHAARRWGERRSEIARLQSLLPTAIVACADWLAEEAVLGGMRNVSVIKNSVDPEFWEATRQRPLRSTGRTKNIFLCRDLRDDLKVDWETLRAIGKLPNQELTVVGNNPIELPEKIRHLPAITNRSELARVMTEHDRLIFTSQVDYFPLTIAEALTAGLEVFAVESRAAREFSGHEGLRIFRDAGHLVAALGEEEKIQSVEQGRRNGAEFFNPERMIAEYLEVYKSFQKS